jgi:hypothetical protein
LGRGQLALIYDSRDAVRTNDELLKVLRDAAPADFVDGPFLSSRLRAMNQKCFDGKC